MPRRTVLIVFLVLIAALLAYLSTQAREVPVRTIEVEVNQGGDAR